jgi:hypothetical protein
MLTHQPRTKSFDAPQRSGDTSARSQVSEIGYPLCAEEAHGYGTDKYGADGLLLSSADRGWDGLSAAIFQHGRGSMSWKNMQPDLEICVDLRGNGSIVTRTGGGIVDRTIAERGTIWMSCRKKRSLNRSTTTRPSSHRREKPVVPTQSVSLAKAHPHLADPASKRLNLGFGRPT